MNLSHSLLLGSFMLCSFTLQANTHDNMNATLWYQSSAEFKASAIQTYQTAALQLPLAIADKNWTALTNQKENFQQLPPAIIVDIDETILDNSPVAAQSVLLNAGFDPKLWDQWVAMASAKAIPGAVSFVNKAEAAGVKVLYISNRECEKRTGVNDSCPQKNDTLRNLKAVGIEKVDASQIWLKSEQPLWSSEKESRRLLAAKDFRILMSIGDDFGDFLPDVKKNITPEQRSTLVDTYQNYWGTKWFVLANPTYGSWQTILEQPNSQYLQSVPSKQ
ncbi:HAD family acid phosphatase [Rheinheimera sp. 1928-s]|uniref:5'-nucleotidase, lipoprotein e(P4) family n=1 Tax=Rheinheimera sp. 1928-s TaxID=3033803 RepID=UPI00262514F9|nr:HAD family acid phosphatase [Rheinheimera sp. 1928-s]MDF3127285.1 HAD family acid phosphatase [Rheinheimera sp. 1928-s]